MYTLPGTVLPTQGINAGAKEAVDKFLDQQNLDGELAGLVSEIDVQLDRSFESATNLIVEQIEESLVHKAGDVTSPEPQ